MIPEVASQTTKCAIFGGTVSLSLVPNERRRVSGENTANLSACLHSPLTGPEDRPERGMRGDERWKRGGDLSKVYPAIPTTTTPPPLESRRLGLNEGPGGIVGTSPQRALGC